MDRKPLIQRKTSISYKTEEKTVLRGYNVSDLAEAGYTFVDALFILFQGRIPAENEKKMLDYEIACFMEHSMSPSAVSAIGVMNGHPMLPPAVAAAISTFGGAHGPGAAHGYMMKKYLDRAANEGKAVEAVAKENVDEYMDAGLAVMGMGQPQHIDGDPRAHPIHLKHEELGVVGVYRKFQTAVENYFWERRAKEGKSYVGVNVVGAGNTALCDIGFAPYAAWTIGSVARGFSCACHALHQYKRARAWSASRSEPMVQMLDLSMIKYVGPEDREVPPLSERQDYAKKQLESGEWRKWVL
jgi:citrate synthase